MTDLAPYIARGFPGDIDRLIAQVPVAGIDRVQTQSQVRLCAETEPILYGPGFSPTALRYRAGSRPQLERIVKPFAGLPPRQRVEAALRWVPQHVRHPHLVGNVRPDRGLAEEQLVGSGVGWCNEQVRVFIALCEVTEVPARICFVYHSNTLCSHTASEAHLDGRWAFFDVTFGVHVDLADGTLARAVDLSGPYRELAHQAYRPSLEDYLGRVLPFVEDCPGWRSADRVDVEAGGDLLDTIGICNYVIEGVESI